MSSESLLIESGKVHPMGSGKQWRHASQRAWEFLACVSLITLGGCGDGSSVVDRADTNPAVSSSVAAVASAIRLRDMTATTGINFTYRNGEEAGNVSILESLGGGVGLADLDGDHDLDVFVPGGGTFPGHQQMAGLASGLFLNEGHWRFREATQPSRVGEALQYSHGSNLGDFDNDGFADILVTGFGRLVLWHNRGDGTFAEIATNAGLTDASWSSSSAWGDLNNDGALDLYVAHYVNWSWSNNPQCAGLKPGQREICPPRRFDPLAHVLYLSTGDGRFRDASEEWGLRRDGKGLGVVIADVDLDGDADIYVGNDTVPNFLYRNTGTRLEDAGLMSGTAMSERGTPDGSMGVDVGDLTGDGLPDIWVANFESESFALYRNQGNCFFQHISQPMGVTAVGALFVGWGTQLIDLDRDGDLDAFCSNGHVVRYPINAPVKQKPLIFENRQAKRFVDAAPLAGEYTSTAHQGRGCAAGDLDDDGDIDLVISRLNDPLAVLSNETATPAHWLSVRLIGTTAARDSVAAIVRLKLRGGREIVSQVKSGSSYASTSDQRVFFGFGEQESVEKLSVQWPSGSKAEVSSPQIDSVLTIIETPAR